MKKWISSQVAESQNELFFNCFLSCYLAPPPLGCFQVDVTDIAILLDSSRSVSANDFDKQLNFTRDILGQFDIGPRQTQAGIIKYGKTAEVQIGFKDYTTDAALFNAINTIKYSDDTESRLDLALKVAKEELFTKERGAREKVGDQIVGKVSFFTTRSCL